MYLSNFWKNLFLLLFLALTPVEVWAELSLKQLPQQDIEISLNAMAKTGNDTIILGDVATIYARSIKDFEKLSNLPIAQIPKGKTELTVPMQYIRSRIQEALGDVAFSLHAPETLQFARIQERTQQNAPEALAAYIWKRALEAGKIPEGVELIVEPGKGFMEASAVDGAKYRMAATFEKASWRGDMSFRMEPLDSKETKMQWFSAKLRWYKNAWVAKRDIRVGENLSADLFTKSRVEVTNPLEAALDISQEAELTSVLSQSRAKRLIRAQSMLAASAIERKPDAKPGQMLKVVFIAESGLRISADGALLENAHVGEQTKARLQKSKKVVSGRLISDRLLEVSL